jgi:hypothetical protein
MQLGIEERHITEKVNDRVSNGDRGGNGTWPIQFDSLSALQFQGCNRLNRIFHNSVILRRLSK